MGNALIAPNVGDAIRELERELKLRARVYPRWVADGKLREDVADWQIACLEKALELVKGLGNR